VKVSNGAVPADTFIDSVRQANPDLRGEDYQCLPQRFDRPSVASHNMEYRLASHANAHGHRRLFSLSLLYLLLHLKE